ncbi:extracellular solute-binding protein [Cohnella hongkongensis]|uniref:Extracellular solute-binding protein n=1 Tax=Cohnella hongkongensis TaxID=178337 RepID=A0ABV9FFS2_9BACL
MLKRNLAILLYYLIGASLLVVGIVGLNGSGNAAFIQPLPTLEGAASYKEDAYQNYIASHAGAAMPPAEVMIEGEDYEKADDAPLEIWEGYAGADGAAVSTGETGSVHWTFRVDQAGLYNIAIRYYPIEGKSSEIERELRIDGEIPFRGADSLIFDRVWANEREEFKQDNRGNELRPRQVEAPRWMTAPLRDHEGFHPEPYRFYLTEGVHTLSLTSLREPMLIDYLKLYQEPQAPAYAEVRAEYERLGYKPGKDAFVKIQGEQAAMKSSPMLSPLTDHTSPSTEPYDAVRIRMNTIGGNNWRLPGQWIAWEVEVPEDGLYKLAFKVKQNLLRGVYSNRKLTIDGEVPFAEARNISFGYGSDWQMKVLGDDRQPYDFYLTKGKHEIKLEVNLGDMAELVSTVESSVLELNAMYRKILTITSATPDPFRDYRLESRIPDMTEVFERQSRILYTVSSILQEKTGEKSDKTAVLRTMAIQLQEMAERPETVAKRLKQYLTNTGALGTWILSVREMPLEVDYLIVASPDQELPEAKSSWWAKAVHEAKAYAFSYVTDYNTLGDVTDENESVTVWIGTGRDQAQVLKAMIDDTFTPETGIGVNLKLVNMDVLLPASLSGEGPDVAMQIGNNVPVNYGLRNAAADLTQFPDYEEVVGRFRESALVPYAFDGRVYALPEQQIFSMLFYRKDILAELGLEVPNTWEDVYAMIPELQKKHMQFALPIEDPNAPSVSLAPNPAYSMLLYQQGGEFYEGEGLASGFDSEVAMNAFKQWTEFYTSYKFPVQFDFANRFRVGEMPIGIADYTLYNLLSVFAPEIRGLWGFTVVPGTPQEDGTIQRDVAADGTAVLMLERSERKEQAWAFMKWWTSKETQVRFGREMEGLMGAAARYPTANAEALKELPWPVGDYRSLEEQWKWVRGIPEVPGGYFTGRHLNNAFRTVVNEGRNPRETLFDYVLKIDQEIDVKREEFNLSDGRG